MEHSFNRPDLLQSNTTSVHIPIFVDDSSTIVSNSQLTVNSRTVYSQEHIPKAKLNELFRVSSMSDSAYISEKKEDHVENVCDLEEDPYRWAILLGGFLAQAISMCIMQEYYDRQVFKGSVDSTALSFVGTIGMSFGGLMGPVTPVLMSLIGVRWILFLSTISLTAGLILASFAQQVWQLYITHSVMHGIGAALFNVVSMSISPQWFIRRRGLSMGIMVSGSGIVGLIMPFVITHLNESLGGAWCYRILGIINFVVSLLPTQGSVLVASFSAVNVVGRIFSGYIGDQVGLVNQPFGRPKEYAFLLSWPALPIICSTPRGSTASSPCTWPLADYRLSFLFPDLRPPLLCGLDSPFALLFGAIDILPADYHQVVPSANSCLQLPVSACLRAVPNTPLNRSLRQLRLSSPYIKDLDSNLLHPRTATEFHVHPYLARKFLRLVRQNHILLAPFLVRPFIPVQYASLGSYPFTSNLTSVVDASPFLLSRKLITVDNSRCLRSKLFCRLCILPISDSKILFPLPPDGWH
ncbi:hypothetical protein G6F62_000372 [Rhizopus arrhizus]|nr:hypothetical protein G6F24_007948 [Rhizopus arrhizus]KAG0787318.1 hypothetical protein G6F21_007984 [Rhizopus arrhizus]KAG0799944.1 hypothetical protein G6F22_002726 [Rhizopus arrhizus]KAG0809309.1 hypothetical protein G6F20_008877 [Rhizopus arrhizus]KAG0827242.1 hypothetical protein G6F19_008886 [Rhizopus arrhizus]